MSEHSRPLELEYDRHTILLLMITLAKRKKMQKKKKKRIELNGEYFGSNWEQK